MRSRPLRTAFLVILTLRLMRSSERLFPWYGPPVFLIGFGAAVVLWVLQWFHEQNQT